VAEAVGYLQGQVRALQTALDSDRGATIVPDVPREAAAEARVDALSRVYAAWAGADPNVQQFRERVLCDANAYWRWVLEDGPYPGYDLLDEDDVGDWLLARHEASLREMVSDEPMEAVDLPYVVGGRPQTLKVVRDGDLGTLAALSATLSERYRWHPAWATLFVLAGTPPVVSTFSASVRIRYGMDSAATTRITLTVDPSLSSKQIAALYGSVRARLQPGTTHHARSLRSYRLAEHVGPHLMTYPATSRPEKRRGRPRSTNTPGGIVYYTDPVGCTWQDLRHSWNQRYPKLGEDGKPWRYDRLSNFTRDAQQALATLLDPGWRYDSGLSPADPGRSA
jgi:hypothetical protein